MNAISKAVAAAVTGLALAGPAVAEAVRVSDEGFASRPNPCTGGQVTVTGTIRIVAREGANRTRLSFEFTGRGDGFRAFYEGKARVTGDTGVFEVPYTSVWLARNDRQSFTTEGIALIELQDGVPQGLVIAQESARCGDA